MQPFTCDKSGSFELGFWGSPVPGRVPHFPFSCRLCHWLLPKLLTRVFLSVQLHRGQLEMVLRAARTVGSPGRALPSPGTPGIHPGIPLEHWEFTLGCPWNWALTLGCPFTLGCPWSPGHSLTLDASLQPEVPLVFLCSHQSPLDGPLLSFLLLSQGVGLPRVAVSTRTSPRLR